MERVISEHPRPPGYRRQGFSYVDDDGRAVTDAEVAARIKALAVPPAWRDVWVAADTGAKVQAVGVDSAGRTQYRYADWWIESRSRDKFDHVPGFAASLPSLREHVSRGLSVQRRELDRDHVLSAAVRLLDLGFFRVGSERYARDNHTYGLTTLQRHHVRVRGETVTFDYSAKEHLHRVVEVADPRCSPRSRRATPSPPPWARPPGARATTASP